MKLSTIKVDAARAEQGAWIKDIPECGDLELQVRSFRNADARRMRAKLTGAIPRAQRKDGILSPETADRLNAQIMANAIIVDWRNLTDENDEPIPFSKQKALELLTDPNYAPFRDAVSWAADRVDEAAADSAAADQGN